MPVPGGVYLWTTHTRTNFGTSQEKTSSAPSPSKTNTFLRVFTFSLTSHLSFEQQAYCDAQNSSATYITLIRCSAHVMNRRFVLTVSHVSRSIFKNSNEYPESFQCHRQRKKLDDKVSSTNNHPQMVVRPSESLRVTSVYANRYKTHFSKEVL